IRAYAFRISKTGRTCWPSGSQYRNLAQALTPCSRPIWLVARGLLSLVSAQLLLHREGEQPSRDQLCSRSKDARARTNLAAASSDARKGSQTTGNPVENDRRVMTLWLGYSLRKRRSIYRLAQWIFAGRSEQHPFGSLIFNVDLAIS